MPRRLSTGLWITTSPSLHKRNLLFPCKVSSRAGTLALRRRWSREGIGRGSRCLGLWPDATNPTDDDRRCMVVPSVRIGLPVDYVRTTTSNRRRVTRYGSDHMHRVATIEKTRRKEN
ncbi:hypothetical protein BHE74_00027773 [Ensete ventricosum]|nr:hypothetical protein BHE74_00027773 [Ensete ventricosum]